MATQKKLERNCASRSCVVFLASLPVFTGCRGAPTVTVAGSYFPAWLLCAILALIVAMVVRVVMVKTGLARVLPLQLGVCLSVGAIVAVVLWKLWVNS